MTLVRWALPAIALVTLPSCAFVIDDPILGRAPPARYREIVANYLRLTLPDVASIRDASIGEPKADQVWTERQVSRAPGSGTMPTPITYETTGGQQAGWAVCWRGTIVKNGAQQVVSDVLLIRGESVIVAATDSPRNDIARMCAGATYAPFPELR
jgi:hypothetical protein